MKRVEIIFSQSVEEDILTALKDVPAAQFFSLIPGTRGKGYTNPKMGDTVWPEVNEIMIIYCDENSVEPIKERIGRVKDRYPREGIAAFVM
jgi:hypothetical protein